MITSSTSPKLLVETAPFFRGGNDVDYSVSLTSTGLGGAPITVGRYRRSQPGFGMTALSNPADVLMFVVPLRAIPRHESFQDGRSITNQGYGTGALVCKDRRHAWQQDLQFAFDTVNFLIPLSELNEIRRETDEQPIGGLDYMLGDYDAVTYSLVQALLPVLAAPAQANSLFLDYIFAALLTYISCAYARGGAPISRGGLTPLQERRVVSRLLDALDDVPSVGELAGLCGLSSGHFIRAFKQTMGAPPHRWLVQQRVERAKILLSTPGLSISEVALRCGFADQSHLTRVFSKACGVAPGRWRRDLLN